MPDLKWRQLFAKGIVVFSKINLILLCTKKRIVRKLENIAAQ